MKQVLRRLIRFVYNYIHRAVEHENYLDFISKKESNIFYGNNSFNKNEVIIKTSPNGRVVFKGDNYLLKNSQIEAENLISIGYYSTIQENCRISGNVEIGNYCLIAPNAFISSGIHNFNYKPFLNIRDQDILRQSDLSEKDSNSKIIIEDDCWIGVNAVIMTGVVIGKGSIIGSNAVVTKNVEPYSVVAGVPAKLLKKRLEFKALNSLSFANDECLPYFYSGFFTDLLNLKIDREIGGIRVIENFEIFIEFEGKEFICIEFINTSDVDIKIKYNNQIVTLTNGISTVKLNIQNTNLHLFTLVEFAKFALFVKSVNVY